MMLLLLLIMLLLLLQVEHPVAIKRLALSLDDDARKREIRAAQTEMQTLRSLRSPVRVYSPSALVCPPH
jgi:hypothetical protein